MYAFINNGFVSEVNASIGISDLALQRGYGVFDFFRVSNFQPLFIDDHLDRLMLSAATLGLQHRYSVADLKQIIHGLIARNNLPEAGIKIFLTGGYSPNGFGVAPANLIVQQLPITLPDAAAFENGINIITHNYLRDLPQVKSINYLMAIYLKTVVQNGADDVLYCNNNRILEFARANIFVVTRHGKLLTPADNILQGITRKKVLQIAATMYQVEERRVSVEEAVNAAEVFLTSTTNRILPVLSVNQQQISEAPGPVTRALLQHFLKAEADYLKHYHKL